MGWNTINPKASKGGAWKATVSWTRDAKNPGNTPVKIHDKDLVGFFEMVKETNAQIVKVWVHKHNLHCCLPRWLGAWHEFTVVKDSENNYWSFEKDTNGLRVQCSESRDAVLHYYRGVRRTGSVVREGRASRKGWKGDTIQDIFVWIHQQEYLQGGYHVFHSNCHYFASELEEAIARKQNRRL